MWVEVYVSVCEGVYVCTNTCVYVGHGTGRAEVPRRGTGGKGSESAEGERRKFYDRGLDGRSFGEVRVELYKGTTPTVPRPEGPVSRERRYRDVRVPVGVSLPVPNEYDRKGRGPVGTVGHP